MKRKNNIFPVIYYLIFNNIKQLKQVSKNLQDSRGQTSVVFVDFSKAFDNIDHKLFLGKLDSFDMNDDIVNFCTHIYHKEFNILYTKYTNLHLVHFRSTSRFRNHCFNFYKLYIGKESCRMPNLDAYIISKNFP